MDAAVETPSDQAVSSGPNDNKITYEAGDRKRLRPNSSDTDPNNSNILDTSVSSADLCELREEIKIMSTQIQNVLQIVGKVSSDLSSLTASVDQIFLKINDHDKKFSEVNDKLDQQSGELAATKKCVDEMERQMKAKDVKMRELEWRLVDQEARSRRNNLLFFGAAEKSGEQCADVIRDIVGKELKLDPAGLSIQRAHRLGAPRPSNAVGQSTSRPRPIIVNFSNFNDRERIWSVRHKLRRPLGISEDFPLEVRKARDSLIPELKELKNRNKKASIAYPARLVSEGKVVREVNVIDFKHR